MLQRTRRAGVSLVELLIAMGVIAVGLAGVVASLYYGHAQSKHGEDLARASQYSRMLIEIASGRNFIDGTNFTYFGGDGLPNATSGVNDSDAEPPRDLVAPPYTAADFTGYFTSATANQDDTTRELLRYKRKIQLERIGAANTAEEHMLRMTVTVFWEPKKEGGRNSVTTTAIVHTNRDA